MSSAILHSEVIEMGKKHSETLRLGTFELTGTILRVSDPCYERDVWCCGTVEDCKPGTWEAAVLSRDEGDWGIRNAILIASHTESGPGLESFGNAVTGKDKAWQECPFEVGVDSGQAGIFDEAHYQDDSIFGGLPEPKHDYNDIWYNHCCDITLSRLGAGVIHFGVVSSSGYGDGGYTAYRHTDQDGKTDAILIVFLED